MTHRGDDGDPVGLTRALPGRPRRADLDEVILVTARRLLIEEGYAGLTLAEVAKQAHVGRPTVYRRWATKFELVADALDYGLRQQQAAYTSVDLTRLPPRDAVVEAVRRIDPCFANPHAMVLKGNFIGETDRHPELLELLRVRAVEPRVSVLRELLVHLRDSGAIRDDIDPVVLTDMCLGSFFGAHLRGERDHEVVAERTAHALWSAIQHD